MASDLKELVTKTAVFLEREKVDYMVIGGFALPSYGAIRATVDLDVAVNIRTPEDFKHLILRAQRWGFEVSLASFSNPVSIFREGKTGLEVEFWLRPDGIKWDKETLGRRRRAKAGVTEFWIVSPEDFIISKLSRPDRGVQDEKDVKGVLTRLGGAIDRGYLEKRAAAAGVLALLQAIERTE